MGTTGDLERELERRGGDSPAVRKAIIGEARALGWPGDWSTGLSEYYQRLKLVWAAEWLYSWRVYQNHVENVKKGEWSKECKCSICHFWMVTQEDHGPLPKKVTANDIQISADSPGINEFEFLLRLTAILDSGAEPEAMVGAIRVVLEERKRGRAVEQERKTEKEFRINVPD